MDRPQGPIGFIPARCMSKDNCLMPYNGGLPGEGG